MKKKIFQVKAQGNSMYPVLRDGDTVEYVHTPFHTIRLNDIILVYSKDILVTHRVIYKTKKSCITRGDNNPTADTSIGKGRILGKVTRFRRKGQWNGIQDMYLAQSAIYLGEIQKLVEVLQMNRIPHAFLKGVILSLRYEGSIPRRIYGDCDLLIERDNYHAVKKLFLELGYRETKEWNVSDAIIPETNFIKIVSGTAVVFDLHFEPHFLSGILGEAVNFLYPASQRKLLTKHILATLQNKKIASSTYSLPRPSMQIIVLALHIFHHNFTDSVRYQLLDSVIRKTHMAFRTISEKSSEAQHASRFLSRKKLLRNDTEILINTIKEYKLEGYVYGVFILLKKYFKTPIPQSFFTAIRPSSFPTSPWLPTFAQGYGWAKRGAGKLIVIKYIVRHVDIFSQDSRMKAGIKRMVLIFFLSPEPFWKKIIFIVHPRVLYVGIQFILSALRKPYV